MPRLYIGNLSARASEQDVERFFRGYGKVMEISIKNGFGFVEFEDTRDADDAVYELNGKDLCGERVIVEHARGPRRDRSLSQYGEHGARYAPHWNTPPTRTDYRLVVENISHRCSWQDLKDCMRQAGEVTYADVRGDEGVVEFLTYSDMRRALEKLHGMEIYGKRIRLLEERVAQARRRRSDSRSRSSRSGGRGGDHSRSPRHSKDRGKERTRSSSKDKAKNRDEKRDRFGSADRGRSSSESQGGSGNQDLKREGSGSKSPSKERSRSKSASQEREGSPTRSDDEDVVEVRSRSPSIGSHSPRQDISTQENGEGGVTQGSRSRSRSGSQPPTRSRSGSPLSAHSYSGSPPASPSK